MSLVIQVLALVCSHDSHGWPPEIRRAGLGITAVDVTDMAGGSATLAAAILAALDSCDTP